MRPLHAPVAVEESGQPEVGDVQLSRLVPQDVVRLQIAMHDWRLLGVQVANGFRDLDHESGRVDRVQRLRRSSMN